jgi:hypothetical protein
MTPTPCPHEDRPDARILRPSRLSVTCATCALRRVLYEEGPVVKSGTSCLANELGSALYRLLDGEERVDGELRAGPIQAGSSGDQIAGGALPEQRAAVG